MASSNKRQDAVGLVNEMFVVFRDTVFGTVSPGKINLSETKCELYTSLLTEIFRSSVEHTSQIPGGTVDGLVGWLVLIPQTVVDKTCILADSNVPFDEARNEYISDVDFIH